MVLLSLVLLLAFLGCRQDPLEGGCTLWAPGLAGAFSEGLLQGGQGSWAVSTTRGHEVPLCIAARCEVPRTSAEEVGVFPGLGGTLWEGLPDSSAQHSSVTTCVWEQLSIIPASCQFSSLL